MEFEVEIYVMKLFVRGKYFNSFIEIFVPERLPLAWEKKLHLTWVGEGDFIGSSMAKPGQYNYYLMDVATIEEIIEKAKNVNSIEDIVRILKVTFEKKRGWGVKVEEIEVGERE